MLRFLHQLELNPVVIWRVTTMAAALANFVSWLKGNLEAHDVHVTSETHAPTTSTYEVVDDNGIAWKITLERLSR